MKKHLYRSWASGPSIKLYGGKKMVKKDKEECDSFAEEAKEYRCIELSEPVTKLCLLKHNEKIEEAEDEKE